MDWNISFALLWGGGYGGIPAFILIVLMASMGPPWNDLLLDQRGVLVQAEPYAVESTGVSVNEESVMSVRVRFRDGAGRPRDAGLSTMDSGLLAQAAAHQPMPIDYDPEAPDVARFHGHKSSILSGGAAFVTPMLVLVFILPGLSAFVWGVLRLLQRRSTYRHGVAAVATVVEHTESSSAENDEHLTIARYEFATPPRPLLGDDQVAPPPAGRRPPLGALLARPAWPQPAGLSAAADQVAGTKTRRGQPPRTTACRAISRGGRRGTGGSGRGRGRRSSGCRSRGPSS
jgi:hypothetical protein